MKYIFSCIACALLTVSCQYSTSDLVNYDNSPIEQSQVQDLPTEEIKMSVELTNPRQMVLLNDSMVVFLDNSKGTLGKVLSLSGSLVCEFGQRGKGHGELLEPVNFSLGRDGRSIYCYDYKVMASQKFQMSESMDSVFFVKTIDYKTVCKRFNSVCQRSDNSYVGFGYDDNCRILNVENGSVRDNYTKYPHIEDNMEYNWSFWSNLANYGVSPDHKHIVTTTAIGMLFEVFDIKSDGKLSSKVLKAFYKPVFLLAKGARPACVIFDNDKTFGGFRALCLGNDKFFGSIFGPAPNYSLGNEIYEFDYDGNLLKKYRVKGNVECMAYSTKGILYMVLSDVKGKNHLVRARV